MSTSAFLYGVEVNGGFVYSVDINPACIESFKGHPKWRFFAADSCDPNLKRNIPAQEADQPRLDVLFIDTLHTYQQLQRELEYWGPCVKRGGLILIHDVLAFDPMAMAATEYALERDLNYEIRPGSNGLGVINC